MAAVNWVGLGYGGPPIVGDPAAVRKLGEGLDEAAGAIDRQVARLDGVKVDEIWQSEAAVGFKEVSAKLPDLLGQASSRYRQAGSALVTYADQLHGALTEMNQWGRVAQDAYDDLHAAQGSLATARTAESQQTTTATTAADTDTGDSAIPRLQGRVDDAAARLRTAKIHINQAVATKDTAAKNASTSLNQAAAILKNTSNWFSGLVNGAKKLWKNLPSIASALRGVAAVLNIAAIALIWVPVLGPIIGTAALVVNVAVLLVDLTLAIDGRGSWANVGWSALAVGLSGFGAFANAGGRIARETSLLARGKPIFPGAAKGLQPGQVGGSFKTAAKAYRPWRPALDVGKELKMVRSGGVNLRPPGFFKNAGINFRGHWGNVGLRNGPKAAAYQWADIGRRALGIGNPENLWQYKPAGLNFPRRFRDADKKWTAPKPGPRTPSPAPVV